MSLNEELNATTGPGKVSRRTLAVGAAWSVPVIAVASAAPAMAASGQITPTFVGGACKHPGNPKYYHFTMTFKNQTGSPITVNLDKMVINGETGASMFPTSFIVPANTTVTVCVDSGLFGNSANGLGVLYFHYVFNSQTINDTISTSINSLPPCDNPVKDDPPHPCNTPS